jgi:DNA-binding CsgD family transcriptional regulator
MQRAQHAWHGTSTWMPAVGSRRRLQALAAMGWSTSQLAARLGVTRSAVAQLRSAGQHRVLATTASAVSDLYDDCWWRTPPGPERDHARTETWAAKHGWLPPWRWHERDLDDPSAAPLPLDQVVDHVAIEETIAGRRVPLTKAERQLIVTELQRRGVTAGEIAERLGRSARTVERYKALVAELRGVV